jgi:D-alanyl-D-alanine carboxypeptidase
LSIVLESWQWEDVGSGYGAHPTTFIVEENAFSVIVTASQIGKYLFI